MKRLLYFLGLLVIASCKKTFLFECKPVVLNLPAITSEGKGTFGCLINNRIWVPNQYKDRIYCEYYPWKNGGDYYGTLCLKSSKRHFLNDRSGGLNMTLRNRVFTIGKAPLYYKNSTKDLLVFLSDTNYYYDNLKPNPDNFINISRLDTVNRIVAGTFQCTLINLFGSGDTVRITEGRFDLRF